MFAFAIGRLAQMVVVMALMSFVIFSLIGLMPGDPIDLMVASNPNLTSADANRLRSLHGLDLPIWERYWNWLIPALGGDFGYSRTYTQPVFDILIPRLGNTLILLGVSSVLAIMLSIPLGVIAAVRRHSTADHAVNLFCFAGISVPAFWFGLLMILLFAVTWGLLPAGGIAPVDDNGLLARLPFLVMPVMTLSLASLAGHTRFMRASMIEVLRQDFVRTAMAKGVSRNRLIYGHALRNAMLPLVTILALDFGALFSGALVTETVFAYLGMGKLIFDSIMGNDFNMALVALLLATFVVLLGNFLADIGYAALDPRISYRGREV